MAIFDKLFEFSDKQDITVTVEGDFYLDMQSADLEMVAGEPMYLNCKVNGAADFAGQGSTTLTVRFVYEGTVDGIDSNSVASYTSATIDEGNLTAGAWIARVALPVNFDEERYVGVFYTVASGPMTQGDVDCWIDSGPQSSYDTQVTTSNI